MQRKIVAIVGRPNVGKSALFNRITGKARAIVDQFSGLTRDRNYEIAKWLGREFLLVDTGGFEPDNPDNIMQQVRQQTELAIAEADVIVMTVDARTGVDRVDRELAKRLQKGTSKPLILAVNKVDNEELEAGMHDFWHLGLGQPHPISALHGRCVDELLDAVIEHVPAPLPEAEGLVDEAMITLAIVGRPNSGKSSLVNRILGEERVLVNDQPGTTRDSVSSFFSYQQREYQILDTAGVRAKRKIDQAIERYAVVRALRTIEESNVVVMLLDGSRPLAEQDEHIAGYIHESGRACILAVNKWDLVEKDDKTAEHYVKVLRKRFSFMEYAPIVTLSAKTGQRVNRLLDLAAEVDAQHKIRIQTSQLNKALREMLLKHPAPTHRGRVLKVKYISQTGVRPPSFALFVNEPSLMHFTYIRHLKNGLRERFGLSGTPLVLMLRAGKDKRRAAA